VLSASADFIKDGKQQPPDDDETRRLRRDDEAAIAFSEKALRR